MTVAEFYQERFGYNPEHLDIACAVSGIETAHMQVAKLLDIVLDALDHPNYDTDHIYATCRGAIAILASVGSELSAVENFCSDALREAKVRSAVAEEREPSAWMQPRGAWMKPPAGGLSAIVARMRAREASGQGLGGVAA
ncbi:hypothetical protein BH09PSE4_BH09PSE4_06930 [soil metagenome]